MCHIQPLLFYLILYFTRFWTHGPHVMRNGCQMGSITSIPGHVYVTLSKRRFSLSSLFSHFHVLFNTRGFGQKYNNKHVIQSFDPGLLKGKAFHATEEGVRLRGTRFMDMWTCQWSLGSHLASEWLARWTWHVVPSGHNQGKNAKQGKTLTVRNKHK